MTFKIKSESEICSTFHVTPEQIDKATRLLDCQSGKVYYQVDSQSEPGKSYEVRYNEKYRKLTCTCLAGEAGYGCWHRRAALAAMYEYRQAENLQARLEAHDPEALELLREIERRDNEGFRFLA